MDPPINATELTYLRICRRKLWLHANGIRLENEHTNVQMGKHLQETAFERKEKDIPLGDAGVIDWAEFKHGILHETKKGKNPAEADQLQVKFYLSWLRKHGIEAKEARIHCPKQRRTKSIPWDDAYHQEVESAIQEAWKIVQQPIPPKVVKLPYCRNCAFETLCYS